MVIMLLKSCVNHFTTVTALTDRALLCVCYGKTVLLMLGAVCMDKNGHTAHITESEIHLTNCPDSCIWDLMYADQTVTKHKSTCSKSSAITLYESFIDFSPPIKLANFLRNPGCGIPTIGTAE